jgi:hypothetical protein
MLITMIISGIWHGAAWTFVIWGALHAVARCATRDLEQTAFYKDRLPRLAKQAAVFAFVMFTWIFFRAQTLDDAWIIIGRIGTAGLSDPRFPLLFVTLILAVWGYELLWTSEGWGARFLEAGPVQVGLAVIMIVYLAVIAQPSTKQFIYFQF